MPTVPPRQVALRDFRRQIERLDALPLRPSSARLVVASLSDDDEENPGQLSDPARIATAAELDPAWVLLRSRPERRTLDPVHLVADHAWWPTISREGADALQHLWRHSVAVSLAARRLAREAGDPDPDRVARAGFLHGLGRWAIAAVDADLFGRWLALTDARDRRELEVQSLGKDSAALGRDLAERWGCDPLVVDATWLHRDSDRGLLRAAVEPRRIDLIQQAYRLAEHTPWAIESAEPRETISHDPRVKLLIAEVQTRCGGPFVEPDASSREERLTRSNARLRLKLAEVSAVAASRERLFTALVASDPTDSPETWAERAGLAWCGEPGVSAARVRLGKSARAI